MQTAKHAIRVARVDDGWTWALVDERGCVAASGATSQQQDAMSAALRAARSFSSGTPNGYPEIILERAASN